MDKSIDLVKKAIEFRGPERVPVNFIHFVAKDFKTDFALKYGNDFFIAPPVGFERQPISEKQSIDEWGCIWESFNETMGEVKGHPLKNWSTLDSLKIPDSYNPVRYEYIKPLLAQNCDKFKIVFFFFFLFERMHSLRGFTQLMEDFYFERENVEKLGDMLVSYNIKLINTFADLGFNGILVTDDWGIQDSLMISPQLWRNIFKPKYKNIVDAAHQKGMKFFLHSCGQISSIIGDLIEIGVDVLQLDQQDNMGIDFLSKNFGGKICFFCPTDIQTTLISNDHKAIEAKAKELIEKLGKFKGGFMAKTYPQPTDIGVTEESVKVMCEAFNKYGLYI